MLLNSIDRKKTKIHLLLASKIAVGSSLAIFIAYSLKLENPVSAGTITLLTLMTTKWESVRLSYYRLLTFLISVMIGWIVFLHIDNVMAAYGAYAFFTVWIAEEFGWRSTISVNAVIGAHLLISQDFSAALVLNEFTLVIIGIMIAFPLNLFQGNRSARKHIIQDMRMTEERLQAVLRQIAQYLLNPELPDESDAGNDPEEIISSGVWAEIHRLENDILSYVHDAYEYQENTFHSHPVYYIDYFEMRYDQCQVLHSLHSSMRQIRSVPSQAFIVADYIRYLSDFVIEKNHPEQQELKLAAIFESMKTEALPRSREEFESRALLFHILKDLDSFLSYKRQFVEKLDEKQLERYWLNIPESDTPEPS